MTETSESTHYLSSFQKPSVIINTGSGSASDISVDLARVFEQKNISAPSVHVVDPSELGECFKTVAMDGTDLLIVYGGDGTCKSGAIVARDNDIPFVALPGGTMNLLPKSLYGTDDWEEALELALSQTSTRWQIAGNINGRIFLCGVIMGDPIIMSEARESLRAGDVLNAIKQVPEIFSAVANGDLFEFMVDGETFERTANALHLACPYISFGATRSDAFELASAPQLTLSKLFGIGAITLADDWRSSPDVSVTYANEIEVFGQGQFDILLDGEPQRVSCPINISLEKKGVLVLAPENDPRVTA